MSLKPLEVLKERFGDAVLSIHSQHGDDTVVMAREKLHDALALLRDDPALRFDMPTDLTAVDWLGREPRFDVVYHLYSTTHKHRVRVKCPVAEEDAVVPTATDLWSGYNWFEREIWDMYGIKFAGHPDLRRMFMYDEFVGHPLRKDYPKEKRQPLLRREGPT